MSHSYRIQQDRTNPLCFHLYNALPMGEASRALAPCLNDLESADDARRNAGKKIMLAAIRRAYMQEIGAWCEGQGIQPRINTGHISRENRITLTFRSRDDAMLFKMSWLNT